METVLRVHVGARFEAGFICMVLLNAAAYISASRRANLSRSRLDSPQASDLRIVVANSPVKAVARRRLAGQITGLMHRLRRWLDRKILIR
jgi:hypothetical protein